ncbi:MAG: tRNA (adenosine(37)-N6)-threonylcarbamoyltransferase complex ATPase subunit type 1 TsaE [Lentisphaeria bacterium]|nr:tRNA (adenosine(37)-N6)-threonylcarbamoyltransferase complex ATPase subunit type 1 TsaE [Lentisphaeria bacterium]
MDSAKCINYTSMCENDTEKIGADVANKCSPGTVVILDGDLGAGKTVFSRGFARALGIDEPVSSPTYTIVQEYELPERGRLYHLDLYRISGVSAALAFGVDEFLNDPSSYALVEWPERIEGILPEDAVKVRLKHAGEGKREITVEF